MSRSPSVLISVEKGKKVSRGKDRKGLAKTYKIGQRAVAWRKKKSCSFPSTPPAGLLSDRSEVSLSAELEKVEQLTSPLGPSLHPKVEVLICALHNLDRLGDRVLLRLDERLLHSSCEWARGEGEVSEGEGDSRPRACPEW